MLCLGMNLWPTWILVGTCGFTLQTRKKYTNTSKSINTKFMPVVAVFQRCITAVQWMRQSCGCSWVLDTLFCPLSANEWQS